MRRETGVRRPRRAHTLSLAAARARARADAMPSLYTRFLLLALAGVAAVADGEARGAGPMPRRWRGARERPTAGIALAGRIPSRLSDWRLERGRARPALGAGARRPGGTAERPPPTP